MSDKKDKIFIGVAWPYVNGDLHVGHLAGYLLPADIFARYNRFVGNDVLMVSGSDSHGTPITVEADRRKLTPQQIVDEYHPHHVELFKLLEFSFDLYTTTTTQNHKEVVQDIFLTLLKNDYIYKDKTKQFYSPKEERFLPDRYVEGTCHFCKRTGARSDQCDECGELLDEDTLDDPLSKITGDPVELKETEHYFLDWAKFEPFLKKYVKSVGSQWRKWILAETSQWLERGLKARAITRDLDWGIEIPADKIPADKKIDNLDSKRIYVWFEAVIGYLSASKEWAADSGKPKAWEDYWHNKKARHYYFMGKDNLVFHTLFWPAQLHGYDETLHLPDVPVINQFLTLEGQQFSKSRGVTVDSKYVAETYGVDNIRFYLATILPETADSIFSWENFVNQNNSLLIGTIGNFLNRTINLAQGLKLSGADVSKEVEAKVAESLANARELIEGTNFKKYALTVAELADYGNKYLAKHEPWAIKKTEPEKYQQILTDALLTALALYVLLTPLTPIGIKKLAGLLGVSIEEWPARGVSDLKDLLSELKLAKARPIYSKIDPKVVATENKKLNF